MDSGSKLSVKSPFAFEDDTRDICKASGMCQTLFRFGSILPGELLHVKSSMFITSLPRARHVSPSFSCVGASIDSWRWSRYASTSGHLTTRCKTSFLMAMEFTQNPRKAQVSQRSGHPSWKSLQTQVSFPAFHFLRFLQNMSLAFWLGSRIQRRCSAPIL